MICGFHARAKGETVYEGGYAEIERIRMQSGRQRASSQQYHVLLLLLLA